MLSGGPSGRLIEHVGHHEVVFSDHDFHHPALPFSDGMTADFFCGVFKRARNAASRLGRMHWSVGYDLVSLLR